MTDSQFRRRVIEYRAQGVLMWFVLAWLAISLIAVPNFIMRQFQ